MSEVAVIKRLSDIETACRKNSRETECSLRKTRRIFSRFDEIFDSVTENSTAEQFSVSKSLTLCRNAERGGRVDGRTGLILEIQRQSESNEKQTESACQICALCCCFPERASRISRRMYCFPYGFTEYQTARREPNGQTNLRIRGIVKRSRAPDYAAYMR
jgi:hypothetical protein